MFVLVLLWVWFCREVDGDAHAVGEGWIKKVSEQFGVLATINVIVEEIMEKCLDLGKVTR